MNIVGVILISLLVILCGQDQKRDVYKLYYLGGQSNMDGFGKNSELPEELKSNIDGVMIFHGNSAPDGGTVDGRGIWAELRPGHGAGFTSNGDTNNYSEKFGIEITFARRLRELNPNSKIAIIKYSRGGTSIDVRAASRFGSWDPDYNDYMQINQYDHFLATIRNAMAVRDIDGDGRDDILVPAGIVWMQGESDGYLSREIADKYESHLRRLMELMRAALRTDDLPVVIGRISDSGQDDDGKVWDYGDIIRQAQASFVKSDGNAALVTSTDNYGYSDPWHYDTNGYIDLGNRFAEALMEIQPEDPNHKTVKSDIPSSFSMDSITYKTIEEISLKLYVFKPESIHPNAKLPAIVFFHGGGWRDGPPSQFYPHCQYFASRGIISMTAEYRLKNVHGTTPFECVKDGKSAMRWVRTNANKLGIDPDRIAAGGGSAGGHIAAATAVLEGLNEEGEDTKISCIPNALVLFNPVLDNSPNGYGYERLKDRYKEISPRHNIKPGMPPSIIFLGTLDGAFPMELAKEYTQAVIKYGNHCELLIYPGQKHGFFNYSDGKNEYYYKTVYDADIFLESIGYISGKPTIFH
jgi:acetyl esterase/lipase